MPCTYIETPQEIAAREKLAKNKTIAPYRRELNRVTRLLCEVMTELSKPIPFRANPEYYRGRLADIEIALDNNHDLQKWWEDHQKRDALRVKKGNKNGNPS